MMKLINNVKNMFFFILPITYICYVLYLRIFLLRLPQTLYVPLTLSKILLILFIIFCLFLRIFLLLKKQGVIAQTENKYKWLIFVKNKILTITNKITQIWVDFLRLFTARFWGVNNVILYVLRAIKKKPKRYILGTLLFLELFPQTIILFVFMIDILYFHEFFYFYKILWLLLLPLLSVALRGLLRQYYEDTIEILNSFIHIELVPVEGTEFKYDDFEGSQAAFSYTFTKKINLNSLPNHITSMEDFLNYYYHPIDYIPTILDKYDIAKSLYKFDWMFLTLLVLHVIGWSIILYYGISF